ncbi:uncharacterized protein TNCV_3533711 [Trichonephila clavipes]|nr:uncharacterized protein TNCV_3533711 [Trichonephila clavipes]
MYREYKLRVASNRSTVEKAIELMIMEAHVRSAQPPLPGTVTIHTNLLQDLQGVKTLYVITDVVFASYVKLSVMMGNRQKSLVYDHDTPIGFKYRKFSLRSDGYFVAEMNTALKFTDKEAHWLRPTPQPVPTVPRWDPMRRRYTGSGGRRKMRNNLTIPTPEEPGRINNRGSWLRDGRSSLNREIRKLEARKMKVQLYCIPSFSTLPLCHWVERNTLKKLEVARTLEKSAHPCLNVYYCFTYLTPGGVIRIERPMANGGVMNTRDVIALENNAPEQNEEWRDNMFQRIYQNNNAHLNNRRSVSLDNIINA